MHALSQKPGWRRVRLLLRVGRSEHRQPLEQLLGGEARRPPANRHARRLTATSAGSPRRDLDHAARRTDYVLNQQLLSLGGDLDRLRLRGHPLPPLLGARPPSVVPAHPQGARRVGRPAARRRWLRRTATRSHLPMGVYAVRWTTL